MTIAQAIAEMRSGNDEGFRYIVSYTAPGIWLAVSLLCGNRTGRVMTEIYQEARECAGTLRSPSDLRIWLCRIAYPMMESHLDASAELDGGTEAHECFRMLSELPRDERTAVLLLCGEGCTAAQASMVCSRPEIEIKRAMRRARASLAEKAKSSELFGGQSVNTAWILRNMENMRGVLATDTELFDKVCMCALTGTVFTEPVREQSKHAEQPVRTEETENERNGFLSRLFRPKRFG